MHSLRLLCTGRPEAGLKAAIGQCPPAVWDSDDLELHVWLDSGRLVNGVRTAFDVATLATLRLEMRETPETEVMLCAAKELTSFTACTLDEFKAATAQHATFEFSSTDTNFAATLDQVWISIVGEDTDGKRHTFTAGYLAIVRNGDSTSTDPVQDPINPYALYAFKTIAVSGQSNVVADTRDDTLTLAAGSGITITTNASTDTITIAASGSGGTWGSITGTLSNQTDLQAALDAKVSTTTVAVTSGKVLTVSNTLTLSGTDGSTLNIGAGGTLGTAAFTAATAYATASHTHLSADVTDATEGGESDIGKLLKVRAAGIIGSVHLQADGLPGEAGGNVRMANATGNFFTVFRAEGATAERTIDLPDADGTLALQEWVTAQTYLTTNGNGSGLTDLNATQLTSGTIPDARFPATLPAASGVNLTALNMNNAGSGTLAVARGGTGVTSAYALLRSIQQSVTRFPTVHWTPLNISGTTTGGTESGNFHPSMFINTATAGKIRLYNNTASGGPVWPGRTGVPEFGRKVVVNLAAVVKLSAHADSRISIHFTHSSVTSHTGHDRSVEGISILFKGGASAGTVEIQTHDGTTASSSATAAHPINDTTGHALILEWEPGVAARLYRGNSLLCTQTANLPTGDGASNSQGIVMIAENTTNGTGNDTFFRLLDLYITELP